MSARCTPERTGLAKRVHDELVKHLVTRSITCIRSGDVLDVRTCVVFLDRDGDPSVVLSPTGYASMIEADADAISKLEGLGLVPDPATVPR